MIRLALALLFAGTLTASAQQVADCSWEADLRNIAEPWEDNSLTFADGLVRLVKLDTGEPARTPFQLLILSPPYGDGAARQCKVIGGGGDVGFSDLRLDEIEGSYDDAVGFMFSVPVILYAGAQDTETPALLRFTVNNVTGQVISRLELRGN